MKFSVLEGGQKELQVEGRTRTWKSGLLEGNESEEGKNGGTYQVNLKSNVRPSPLNGFHWCGTIPMTRTVGENLRDIKFKILNTKSISQIVFKKIIIEKLSKRGGL